MKREILPIVITGHIDHGKSTLIGRLLYETHSLPKEKLQEIGIISKQLGEDAGFAFFSDQLKEERDRMMTIDTTQMFFNTRKRSYCIIDTPGHPEFLRNMITGTSYAEAAVLVVDVNEGIMDETRRHLYVIQLLGIKQMIVALNKMDLVGYGQETFNRLKEEFSNLLRQFSINTVIVLPISAKENDNISAKSIRARWFRGLSMVEALDSLKIGAPDINKPLTLPVQDVYKIDGREIIVGMISSGRLKPGQKIIILPECKDATIKRIIGFDKKTKSVAEAGENVGLSLKEPLAVKRGDIIVDKESPLAPATNFKGNILWLSPQPLRINTTLTLVCATQSAPCVVEKIEKRLNTATLEIIEKSANELKTNEAAQLSFRTKKPILLTKFTFIEELGRFLLERDENVQAAGIVT
jgi:sulfate adenylyltransferase subunit 1 (EFTu-like GTPase family)